MRAGGFNPPRGMRDILPDEVNSRIWVYGKIREVIARYGFEMVEPSPLEDLRTLEAKSGPSIRKEIYWFKDKAGRSLGLRFDLTVGLARIVSVRSNLPEPIKYAALGGSWRYDEPQHGRYRHFTQWDLEIFGSGSPLADAEVICAGIDMMDNVGVKDIVVRISSRKLIEAYLRKLGVGSSKKIEECLRIIDKLRKAGRQQLKSQFKAIGLKDGSVDDIFAFISIADHAQGALAKLEAFSLADGRAREAIEELRILSTYLADAGCLGRCVYDFSIVRGIGYYDGIVFEAFDKGAEDLGAIFAGGRYDKLCGAYGKRDLPATGAAGGIERLLISLERAGGLAGVRSKTKIFVASPGRELVHEVFKIVQRLRRSGIGAEFDLKDRNLSKQLEYANSRGIPYSIVVGRRELESSTVKIKDMSTGRETESSITDLPARIQSLP